MKNLIHLPRHFKSIPLSRHFCTKLDINDDILPDHLIYKIPNYKKNPKSIDFPWLINGAPFLDFKARFLSEQIFIRSQVTKASLLMHLFKIYRGVLLAISEDDDEFLKEYCEEIFYKRLRYKLDDYKEKKYTIELVEDMKANHGYRLMPEMHLYDSIVIKGLFTDRKLNRPESEYSICNDIEDMGFVSYIPSYVSDPNNFKDKESSDEIINKGSFRNVIFRAYTMFKSGLKLFVYDSKGEKLFEYTPEYNFNHACIFECLMVPPSHFSSFYKAETYTEWIAKHKFGVWKMIDMDNWMKGNSYFLPSN